MTTARNAERKLVLTRASDIAPRAAREWEVPFTRSDRRIVWRCGACHRPVTAGTGYLEADVYRHRQYHDVVPWLVWHRKCDPDLGGSQYWIAIERVATLALFGQRADHLKGKVWITDTDFAELLGRVGEWA